MAYLFRFLRRSATPRYSVLSGRKPGRRSQRRPKHGGGQPRSFPLTLSSSQPCLVVAWSKVSKGKVVRQWLVVQIRFLIGLARTWHGNCLQLSFFIPPPACRSNSHCDPYAALALCGSFRTATYHRICMGLEHAALDSSCTTRALEAG